MKTIALIDDDFSIREVFSTYLLSKGYNCIAYSYPLDFIKDVREHKHFDIVITDVSMPKVSGLELLSWLQRYYPKMSTIVMTAHCEQEIASIAYQGGACLFLEKPLRCEQLNRTIRLLSQEGLSGEVFHITLIDCLQTLACDSQPRILKIQQNASNYFLLALQNNQLEGLSYVSESETLAGAAAFKNLICVGDATFSELNAEAHQDLLSQSLAVPLPRIALQIAQYQDELVQKPLRAQTLGIWGPEAQKQLLSKLLNNMGFEISEQKESCQAHIVLGTGLPHFEQIMALKKPMIIAEKYAGLFSKSLKENTENLTQIVSFKSMSEWAVYINHCFLRGLSGTLNKISVFQLIQLISHAGSTACIQLKDLIKQEESTLYFVQGKLVEALSPQQQGEKALLEGMRIRMGYFQQIPFVEPISRSLETFSVTRLLMNCSRPFELEGAFVDKIDSLMEN